jgi:hypothetical protein
MFVVIVVGQAWQASKLLPVLKEPVSHMVQLAPPKPHMRQQWQHRGGEIQTGFPAWQLQLAPPLAAWKQAGTSGSTVECVGFSKHQRRVTQPK